MKPIRRWNDREDLMKSFRNEMDNMFQRFFDDSFFSDKPMWKESFTPACNIEEKRNKYIVELEVPGVEPDDIEIEIDENVMTIKGERKQQTETKDDDSQMHIVEHNYGSFYRSFTLPDNVNTDEIDAHDKNGILYITIPKQKERKVRRIKIGRRQSE